MYERRIRILKLINGIKGLSAGGAATGAASAGAAAGTAWASSFVNAVVSVAPALASILGITAVALTPALVANQKTFEQAEAQRSARIDEAGKLSSDNGWFLEASANALGYQRNANGELDKSIVGGVNLGNMDQIYSLLMGMNNRSDMQKAQLQTLLNGSVTSQGNYTWSELQKLWGGLEDFDGARMTAVLDSVADAYAKMSEETSDLTSSTDESSKASQEMSAAANADFSTVTESRINDLKANGIPLEAWVMTENTMPNADPYITGFTADRFVAEEWYKEQILD